MRNRSLFISRLVLFLGGLLLLFWDLSQQGPFTAGRRSGIALAVVLLAMGWSLSSPSFLRWFLRRSPPRSSGEGSPGFHVVLRALLVLGSISLTFFLLTADYWGLDPTPGWGYTRVLEFGGSLILTLAGFALFYRPGREWLRRVLGTQRFIPWQTRILRGTQWLVGLIGLGIVGLVVFGPGLELYPVHSWTSERRLELCVGLCFIAGALLLRSRWIRFWLVRTESVRFFSPMRIVLFHLVRMTLLVVALATTFLVLGADLLGLDPTPGWGWPRFTQLLGGLLLLGLAMVLHSRWAARALRRLGRGGLRAMLVCACC
jgi:hypothetical protein